MRSQWIGVLGGLLVGLSLSHVANAASITDDQVARLVEALRRSGSQRPASADLYSDWQVKAENIPRWSEKCIGRKLTPQEFASNSATAGGVVSCVIRDVLATEFQLANGDEALAVRRVAAWWMTGDAKRYNSAGTAAYTESILSLYQQQRTSSPAQSSPTQKPASTNNPDKLVSVPPGRSTPYDRYMQVGYAATQKKDYPTALLFFKRALDERPNDLYATQAIKNISAYLGQGSTSSQAGSSPAGQ